MEQLIATLRRLLDGEDWTRVQTSTGGGEQVPDRLLALVQSADALEAEQSYWRLDNHVVVQGRAYRSAALLLPSLMVASTSPAIARAARRWVVELLTEIALARPHEDEPDPSNVATSIADSLAMGRWTVYGLLADPDDHISRAAAEIIRRIEPDGDPR